MAEYKAWIFRPVRAREAKRLRKATRDRLWAEWIDQGVPKAKVARDLGIGRATLYRLLAKAS